MRFSYQGSIFEVLKTTPSTVTGWTHSAEVKRLNGKKTYYANIVVVDGLVINAKVIG